MSLLKSGASGLMGALGGPWGLAIGAASTGLGLLAQKHQEAAQAEAEHKQHQQDLKDSLDQTTGAVTAQTKELQLQALEESGLREVGTELGLSTETMADAMTGNAAAMQKVNDTLDSQMEKASQGNDRWQGIKGTMGDIGISYEDVANAAEGVAGAQEKIDSALSNSGMNDDEIRSYKEVLQEAQDEMGKTEENAAKLRGEIGRLTDSWSTATTDELQQKLRGISDEAGKVTSSLDILNSHKIRLADPTTLAIQVDPGEKDQVMADLKEIGLESEYNTQTQELTIDMPNGGAILAALHEMGNELVFFEDGKTINVQAMTEDAQQKLVDLGMASEIDGEVRMNDDVQGTIDRLVEMGALVMVDGHLQFTDNIDEVIANVGKIPTQTNSDHHISDNVPEVEQHKEQLKTPTSSTHTVYHQDIYDNNPAGYNAAYYGGGSRPAGQYYASGGLIPALAVGGTSDTGGRLPLTGPGTDRTDGILGIDGNGIPTARVDAGEWVVNRRSSARFHPVLNAINNGDADSARRALDMLPAHASGGVVDSIIGLVNENFPMMSITSTYRNSSDLHGAGKAVDASNGYDDTPEMQTMAQWFYDRYQYQLAELIHSPFGNNVKNGDNVGDGMGFYGAGTMSEHRNHVHIAANAPLDEPDESWKDRTKDENKDETPEEKSRSSAASSAADEEERRRKMVAESKPEIVETTVTIGPDPVAVAMFNDQNDPDGLLVLTRGGDYTDRFGARYGVGEDDTLVRFLLWAKGGQDDTDDDLASAFTVDNDPKGIRALTEAGVFTQRFGDAFGVDSNSPLVTAVLAARAKGGVNTLRVSAWADEYGDVDTSVSGIAGKVAKSFVESAVGDVFSAFGVEDDLGPLTQAAIAGAKYAYGINTGTSYENMQSAAKASGQQSTKFSSAYSDMTASEADSAGATSAGRTAAQYDPSRGAEQWRDTIIDALSRTGRPSSEEGVTEQQVQIESGGNPSARNDWDSNAAMGDPSVGLLQVIGSTFRAFRDPSLPDDQTDPLANLVAGIKYATATYGGPASIWPTTAGYANGGMFGMLRADQAQVVPANTFRMIGDRPVGDEFFLPDDPSSIPVGQEWARRRGLQLTIADNQRRREDRMAAAMATQVVSGPTYQSHVNVNGFDRREVTAGIREADRIARWKEGF